MEPWVRSPSTRITPASPTRRTGPGATPSPPSAPATDPAGRSPTIAYTAVEHDVWRTVSAHLAPSTSATPAPSTSRAAARLDLPTDEVPQLAP